MRSSSGAAIRRSVRCVCIFHVPDLWSQRASGMSCDQCRLLVPHSVRQSQRPPPPPLRPCPGRAHEPPSAPNPVDLWTTQDRASPTNPQVQQQQQASAYSVRNGVERVPTLDPHANPVSEIHRPASRRTPGGIIPESRATSSRNGGQHHVGIPGRLRRNPQAAAPLRRRHLFPTHRSSLSKYCMVEGSAPRHWSTRPLGLESPPVRQQYSLSFLVRCSSQ